MQLDTRTHGRLGGSTVSLNCKVRGKDPLGYTTVPVSQKRTWRSRVGHNKKVLELMGVASSGSSLGRGSECCPQS